jgi:hypothetical protein
MIRTIVGRVLLLLQRTCNHDPSDVSTDVLDGCVKSLEVKWCRRCGAIRIRWNPSETITTNPLWRRPDPEWAYRPDGANIVKILRRVIKGKFEKNRKMDSGPLD